MEDYVDWFGRWPPAYQHVPDRGPPLRQNLGPINPPAEQMIDVPSDDEIIVDATIFGNVITIDNIEPAPPNAHPGPVRVFVPASPGPPDAEPEEVTFLGVLPVVPKVENDAETIARQEAERAEKIRKDEAIAERRARKEQKRRARMHENLEEQTLREQQNVRSQIGELFSQGNQEPVGDAVGLQLPAPAAAPGMVMDDGEANGEDWMGERRDEIVAEEQEDFQQENVQGEAEQDRAPIVPQPPVAAAAPDAPRMLFDGQDRVEPVREIADHQAPAPAEVPVPVFPIAPDEGLLDAFQPLLDVRAPEVHGDDRPPIAAAALLNRSPRIDFVPMEAWFWETLYKNGHEVVVTSGRRTIQPRLHFDVNDLDVAELYSFGLCVQLVDTYVYDYDGRAWIQGSDTNSRLEVRKEVAHPDGVKTGGEWMAAPLRFDNVRITLNETKAAQDGNVIRLLPKRMYAVHVIVRKCGILPDSLIVPIQQSEFITTPDKFKDNVNYWLQKTLGVDREEIRRKHEAAGGVHPPIPERKRKPEVNKAKVCSTKRTRFN